MDQNQSVFILKAANYAAGKHYSQRRKGYKEIPYINHPIRVALILSENGISDPDILVAALLHDVLEDTDGTEKEIEELFGSRVLKIVLEMTDNMNEPSDIRKAKQVEEASTLSDEAKQIKIADKICNIYDIINYPLRWSTRRKYKYILWAEQVVEGCRGINPGLEKIFDDLVTEGKDWFSGGRGRIK